MMRVAAIDVGTNTAQLLVAEVRGGAIVRRVHTDERFVRLGEGVDARGQIGAPALDRLLDALRAQQEVAERHGAEPLIVGATSASRDADNRQEVAEAVQQATGLTYEVLSGDEEAIWTFAAACDEQPKTPGPTVVIDIGGGSTEVIVGAGGAAGPDAVRFRRSLDIGSVRLTERFFDAQPPSARAVQRAVAAIDTALESLQLPSAAEATLVGTSGTTEALALVQAGPSSTLDTLDDEARWLSADAMHQWQAQLLRSSIDDVRALHPEAMRGRADVFPMGVLILDRFLQETGLGACRVSTHQLRYGLILRWLHQQQGGA
jgi:exopolyphosphatase/guanosine-5'-triphosphate,3'-diphosphate pyrophosphatase